MGIVEVLISFFFSIVFIIVILRLSFFFVTIKQLMSLCVNMLTFLVIVIVNLLQYLFHHLFLALQLRIVRTIDDMYPSIVYSLNTV